MGFHHVAVATRDLAATHAFYTDVMGFTLAKVVAAPTPASTDGGWAKHVFYETGSTGMIAFWELHDSRFDDYSTDLNKSIGLPEWVNHLAFNCDTIEEFHAARDRWLAHGMVVPEVDHEFCLSIYGTDPNGIMVEFCHTVRAFTDADLAHAHAALGRTGPDDEPEPKVTIHHPNRVAAGV